MVQLDRKGTPEVAIEFKWSDRHFENATELEALLGFCAKHLNLNLVVVTTKTKRGSLKRNGKELVFLPTAAFAYHIAKAILEAKMVDPLPAAMAALRA